MIGSSIYGFIAAQNAKEPFKVGFDYFKANVSRVSGSAKAIDHDYHLHIVELHNTGAARAVTRPGFVVLCSGLIGKPILSQMVILGDMSLGGSIIPVENLAETLQVVFNTGALYGSLSQPVITSLGLKTQRLKDSPTGNVLTCAIPNAPLRPSHEPCFPEHCQRSPHSLNNDMVYPA